MHHGRPIKWARNKSFIDRDVKLEMIAAVVSTKTTKGKCWKKIEDWK